MKHVLGQYSSRLVLAIIVGSSLGLLFWEGLGFSGWNKDTVWFVNGIYAVAVPLFALAAVGNLVINALFMTRNSTRSLGAKWFSRSIIFWLVSSCVVFAAFRYYGPVSDGLPSFLVGSMYLGGAVSFGFLVLPLYLWGILRTPVR